MDILAEIGNAMGQFWAATVLGVEMWGVNMFSICAEIVTCVR